MNLKKWRKNEHLISADDYHVTGFGKHDPKNSLLSAFAVSCGLTASVSHEALWENSLYFFKRTKDFVRVTTCQQEINWENEEEMKEIEVCWQTSTIQRRAIQNYLWPQSLFFPSPFFIFLFSISNSYSLHCHSPFFLVMYIPTNRSCSWGRDF